MHLVPVTIATTTAAALRKAITITITTILLSRKRSCCLCEILKPLMATTHTHAHTRCKTSHIDLHTAKHIQDMALIFGIPHVTSPSRRHSTKSRMINCQNMLGKGKHGEQRIKKKTQNQHQQHNKKCVCMCANEFFCGSASHTHTDTHTGSLTTHVFVLSCHYVTTDTRFIIICRPVWLCAGVCVCECVYKNSFALDFSEYTRNMA